MGEYSRYIARERRSVPTPRDMVKDGKCVFGTFDKEFETMDLLSIKNATEIPENFNRLRLTLWEAVEVHLEEGILLAACSDMALFGAMLCVFYDKRKKKVYQWVEQLASADVTISPNLINGAKTVARKNKCRIRFVNHFEKGKATVQGAQVGESGEISYQFKLTRISKPSVVSIPFDDISKRHRPLYTQKDFFRAEGSVTINGVTYKSTEQSTAIIDDHRGYYPRKSHYDWLTTMGLHKQDGTQQWLAFNLTRNQSIDQEKYNENLIWFENETSLLPPVTFYKDIPTAEFAGKAKWHIKDEHDMVNLDFTIYDLASVIIHAKPVINSDYYIVFGEVGGYVRDEDGKQYFFDKAPALGEDKTLLF